MPPNSLGFFLCNKSSNPTTLQQGASAARSMGAHVNRSGTPAVPPRSQTPAWNAVFEAFLLEWESCTPRLCRQHTPPRKPVQDAFLQPPMLLHRCCLWPDFGALLFSCDSAPPFLLPDKGMSQHSPIPRSPASPFQHLPPHPAVLCDWIGSHLG